MSKTVGSSNGIILKCSETLKPLQFKRYHQLRKYEKTFNFQLKTVTVDISHHDLFICRKQISFHHSMMGECVSEHPPTKSLVQLEPFKIEKALISWSGLLSRHGRLIRNE